MDSLEAFEVTHSETERYRLLIDAITDYAIYMLDPRGRVSSWNPGARRFKGYEAAEIVGEHFSRFYTPEDQETGLPARALNTAAVEGRYEAEGWRVRKDGSRFWAHVIIDPIRDEKGRVISFAKITRDITERRETQLALEEARLALFQSQKLEAIGQLTGGIAHDFNNLLMAVLGSLELLRKRLPGEDAKAEALLNNAIMGAQRGAALTQRMLSFARKQELKLQGVDIPVLVAGMAGLLQRSLGPGVNLTTRFPPSMLAALTDANQLESALLNLVVNARDAMGEGGSIVIEGAMESLGAGNDLGLPLGDYVRLAVTDDGEGMDPQTLARAAEPFYTTKGVGKGTGLGLAMVHGLAEQSGGRLVLKSQLGLGSRMEIWLPQASAAADEELAPDTARLDACDLGRLTILAVDDDALVLTNTAAMLEDLGHRAVIASSADEALAILGQEQVDLVLTDHVMPRMTGLQLVEKIAQSHPDLPVILATGYAELGPGMGEGVPRLAKPYSQRELDRLLRETGLSSGLNEESRIKVPA